MSLELARSTLPRPAPSRLVPAVIFVILAALTLVVWRQQLQNQRALVQRHTEDVCLQSSRRLEFLVDFRLTAAQIFARRWSNREQRDFSRQRFEEFARLLIAEIPGYGTVQLVPPTLTGGWIVHGAGSVDAAPIGAELRALLEEVRRDSVPRLSPPLAQGVGQLHVYAALPLRRGAEVLGFVLVELDTTKLLEACCHSRIRAEFGFRLSDGGRAITRYSPSPEQLEDAESRVAQTFPVRNRVWTLTLTPRPQQTLLGSWRSSLGVPLLGLLLSVSLAWLVHLLSHRMDMYRAAHGRALSENLERQRAEQRQALLARKALMAQEEERARISRELHDELGQLLTALRFELDIVQKRVARAPTNAAGEFQHAAELVEKAAAELRRICKGLRPPLLDDLGLEPAAQLLVDEFREHMGIGIAIALDLQLDVEGATAVTPEVALCTYRILQESLTNVGRHAGAKHLSITLLRRPQRIELHVTDDGRGFDPADPSLAEGSGMAGMRERANLVGGTLEIRSVQGQGTRLEFHVPSGTLLAGTGKEVA